MIITMILIFVLGYLCIALEHKLRIDKAAIALLMCGALWTVLSLLGNDAQIGTQLIEQLGDTSEILFFLIGAMTIVELIDRHGGFHVITDHIKTRNKRKLLWMRGNVTSGLLVAKLFLPALVSVIIPTAIACRYIPDENAHPEKLDTAPKLPPFVGPRFSHFVLVLGVGGLLFVPIFKAVTGLPPYLGMLISLGVLWVFTELVYDHKQNMEESIKNRVSKVLKHIDMPTILFFLGILMSVAALQSAGLLTDFADFLDKNVHEVYTIAGITGLLSAVIDNVPLVAACMGMYPVVDTAALASSLDPVYMQAFVQDGIFWHLLTFCAGVGGSLLIIGSAAGVVAMGLEKIEFGWYLRKITLLALAGYFAGMLVIFLEHLLLG